MWFFKRKKKIEENKPDFSKYKIKINGKVMCAYEAMTEKPFLKIETEDDIKHLFYCSLVFNNPDFETLEYSVFEILINDPSVAQWISNEYVKINNFLVQFKGTVGDNVEDDEKGKASGDNTFYMIEAISGLIVRMGLDPHYVMYDMDEWEISYYYRIMRDVDRERLTEGRMWTYLTILPHVGRKIGSPDKMLPFEWEKHNKRAQRELENNSKAVFAFLTKTNDNAKG
jgi:hypothetical protein